MSKLYFEALSNNQKQIFPRLKEFSKIGSLGGGTGLALQLGHRRSYDFDIFSQKPLPEFLAFEIKKVFGKKLKVIKDSDTEFTFITQNKVKITFFHYPFPPLFKIIRTLPVSLFHFRDIASDKVYTIGRRGTYRDYVDLFFLFKEKYLTLNELINNTEKKFNGLFSEKLFLEQLIYLKDIEDFSVEFLREKYKPEEIKEFFEKIIKQYTKAKIKR